jgi:hypothetical protein
MASSDCDWAYGYVLKAYWGHYTDKLSTGFRTVSQPAVRKKLNWQLAQLMNAAKAHETNGLAAGSSEYQLLYLEADRLLGKYAAQFGVSRALLDSQVPALSVLKTLSAATPPDKSKLLLFGLAVASPVLLGLAYGTFLLVCRWLGHF